MASQWWAKAPQDTQGQRRDGGEGGGEGEGGGDGDAEAEAEAEAEAGHVDRLV